MEKKIFEWKEWNTMDFMHLQFYDITMLVDIDDVIKRGEKFQSASFDYEKGMFYIYDDNGITMFAIQMQLEVDRVVTKTYRG